MARTMTDELPAAARVITSGDVPEPPAGASSERHSAARYFWTWLVTPHIEFGAIYVGMVVVLFLDMSLVQALIGIVLGVGLGALSHAILTATGVRLRIPPIALGRRAFGEKGNRIPATLMAIVSSVGWFIFNSLFAALAINAVFGLPTLWALAIVVVLQLLLAQFPVDHKALRRYLCPIVTLVFVVSGIFAATAITPGADPGSQWNLNGIIAIIVVACMAWAYTIGWSPYATDYSGVVPKDVSPRAAGVGAALGLFVATTFFMMVGVVAAIAFEGHVDKATNPTEQFASILPSWLGVLALVAIVVGSLSSNTITLRSARSVIRIGSERALSRHVWPIVITIAAFFIGWALSLNVPANFEGYIMVLGYWISPWLSVILVDQRIRRRQNVESLMYSTSVPNRWGLFSVLIAIIGSICLWGLQVVDDARLPHGAMSFTVLGLLVGFYLAGFIYSIGLKRMLKSAPESSPTP